VGLDTLITPQLEMEGIAREFVNRIQNLRKESNLQVLDRIRIYYSAPKKIDQAVQQMSEYITNETLAVKIHNMLPAERDTFEISIDSETLSVAIEKITE
jgi:isoleucyl-tRNA synthetase